MNQPDFKIAGLLLMMAVALSLWLTAGSIYAETPFQSPESPVEEPPAQTEEPPAAEQEPPAEAPATEEEPAAPDQTPTETASLTATLGLPTTPAPDTPIETERERVREPLPAEEETGTGMVLDEAELIDTVIIYFSSVWLCCGMGLIVAIPLVLLILFIRGRSIINREGL